MNQLSQTPEYPLRGVSIFFENSRRYLVFTAQGALLVSLTPTPVANVKNLHSEKFEIFGLGAFG
jgi:hypothetical protein